MNKMKEMKIRSQDITRESVQMVKQSMEDKNELVKRKVTSLE
jgi:hypothetical protein